MKNLLKFTRFVQKINENTDTPTPDKNEKQAPIKLSTQKVLKPTSLSTEVNFRIFDDGRFQYQIGKDEKGREIYSPIIRLSYNRSDSQYTVNITDIEPNKVSGTIKPPREEGSSEDPRETGVMTLTFDPEVVWKGLNEFIKTKPQRDTYKEIGNTKKREMTDLTKYGEGKHMAVATYPLIWTIT